jgi:hypothetical protein
VTIDASGEVGVVLKNLRTVGWNSPQALQTKHPKGIDSRKAPTHRAETEELLPARTTMTCYSDIELGIDSILACRFSAGHVGPVLAYRERLGWSLQRR